MYPILFSTFVTAVVYLLDSFAKCKKHAYHYFILFLLILGLKFLFLSQVHADEIFAKKEDVFAKYIRAKGIVIECKNESNSKEKDKPKSKKEVMKKMMEYCREKIDYHHDEAKKCFHEAEEACLWFPNREDQEKADWCFASAIAALYPGNPAHKIIAGIITLCAQYGQAMIHEWQYIDTKLRQAQNHYEMEEFYREVGNYQVHLLNLEKQNDK